MTSPRNSAEVVIKLLDVCRRLGVPAKMESSMVMRSDSRYLILFPKTRMQAAVRVSSHKPFEDRYALCLGVARPDLLRTAVEVGTDWLEQNYGPEAKASRTRGWTPTPELFNPGVSRAGRVRSRNRQRVGERPRDGEDGLRGGGAAGVRAASPFEERASRQARRFGFELTGDD